MADSVAIEIVDVEGHWVLHWPEGQVSVTITREVAEYIVAGHNESLRARTGAA